MTFFAFGIGCFVGTMVTILSLALASAASDRDDWWEEE
jgi:hypothetical protein